MLSRMRTRARDNSLMPHAASVRSGGIAAPPATPSRSSPCNQCCARAGGRRRPRTESPPSSLHSGKECRISTGSTKDDGKEKFPSTSTATLPDGSQTPKMSSTSALGPGLGATFLPVGGTNHSTKRVPPSWFGASGRCRPSKKKKQTRTPHRVRQRRPDHHVHPRKDEARR